MVESLIMMSMEKMESEYLDQVREPQDGWPRGGLQGEGHDPV